ncbi:hypothetical protein LX36DRAFT_68423 [Colletotrichum falcatum]|nr:hypothetical protein LX36DRAFT_68423 [Colletotrichum falcatum]
MYLRRLMCFVHRQANACGAVRHICAYKILCAQKATELWVCSSTQHVLLMTGRRGSANELISHRREARMGERLRPSQRWTHHSWHCTLLSYLYFLFFSSSLCLFF